MNRKKTVRNNHTSILYVFDLVDLTTSVSSFSSSECSDNSKPPSCNTRIVTITDLFELYIYHRHIVIICLRHIPKRVHAKNSVWIYLWPPIQESVHGLKMCTAINNFHIGKMLNRFQFILKIRKLMERKRHNEKKALWCTALFPDFYVWECKCQWCWVAL